MNIQNVSFGAKIDSNTMKFLIKARKKNLNTQKMETLMKQISPSSTIMSSVNIYDDVDFMYLSGTKYTKLLPNKYIRGFKTNQETVDLITANLERIKKSEKNPNNEKVIFKKIYKRDHQAELKEIFGKPEKSFCSYDICETDY